MAPYLINMTMDGTGADAVLFLAGQGFMAGTVLEVAGGAHLPTGR
jgi:hypothetical protein